MQLDQIIPVVWVALRYVLALIVAILLSPVGLILCLLLCCSTLGPSPYPRPLAVDYFFAAGDDRDGSRYYTLEIVQAKQGLARLKVFWHESDEPCRRATERSSISRRAG